MADSARRKEKQRLKRKEKQRAMRVASSMTPLRKLIASGGTLDCWINRDWRDQGMASIYVLGHAGGESYAFAGFLVDAWCVGLKDAWGLPEISRLEFQKKFLDAAPQKMNIMRIEPQKVRELVAGGIRFARQNGFKLPPHYDRWTAVLGNLGDIGSADVSLFGKDGQLLYMGDRRFLVQRLVGMTPEQFLARPNVKMIMPSGDLPFTPKDFDRWSESTDAQDSVPPIISRAARGLVELADRGEQVIKQWCAEHDKTPPTLLNDALMILFAAMFSAGTPKNRDSGEVAEDAAQRVIDVLKDPNNGHPPETREALVQMLEIVSAMGMREFMDRMQSGEDLRD